MKPKLTVSYQGCQTTASLTDRRTGAGLGFGVANWNPEDPYDKQLGRQIAVGRAVKDAQGRKLAAERLEDERQQAALADLVANAPGGSTDVYEMFRDPLHRIADLRDLVAERLARVAPEFRHNYPFEIEILARLDVILGPWSTEVDGAPTPA